MASKPTIALHLGAHKTATTYIQSRLLNSRDAMQQCGIAYVPMAKFRRLITNRIAKGDFSPAELRTLISEYAGCERLILSDENILGGTHSPNFNQIYAHAKQRLSRVLPAFDRYPLEVFVTLRSYPEYFASRYAETLRAVPFVNFRKFYQNLDFETVSWLDVVSDIKAAGVTNLKISDFSNIFSDEQKYFDMLLGTRGIALNPAENTPGVRRARFTQQGYDVVRFYAKHYGANSAKKIMALLDETPQETPATPFMPFSDTEKHNLESRYAAEVKSLLAGDQHISGVA